MTAAGQLRWSPWSPWWCGDEGVHTPDGWIGVDPTNNQIAGSRYVTTARGRDYSDVPPLKGVIYTESTSNELHVVVDVSAVDGDAQGGRPPFDPPPVLV